MAKKKEAQKPNTDKFLVSQSNDLVEATYSTALTARAHKVARLLLALIKPDDHDLRLYSVKIDDLKEYLGNSGGAVTWGRFYEDLKDISKRLNSEPIEIKSDKKALVAYFISSYEIDLRAGTVTYEISSQLKPYLIQLKGNFTAYQLSNIPKLNSKYSIRLYELLHQYRRFGRRVFEMADLQRKIGSEYEKYSHFKSRVLDATKADLEANSDLSFDYEEIKEGKKVTRIEFFIYSSQPQKKKTDNAPPPVLSFITEGDQPAEKPSELSETTIATLKSLGIHTKNIEKQLDLGFKIVADESARKEAVRRCGELEAYYLEKIALLRESKGVGEGNPAGFLIKALQEDWQSSKVQREQQVKSSAQKVASAANRIKQLTAEKEARKVQHEKMKAPLFESLLADVGLFGEAYKNALAESGEFVKDTLLGPKRDLSPMEQFRDSPFLASMVKMQLQKLRPELFAELESKRRTWEGQIEEEIGRLKK